MADSFWLACMATGTIILMLTIWAQENDRDPPLPWISPPPPSAPTLDAAASCASDGAFLRVHALL